MKKILIVISILVIMVLLVVFGIISYNINYEQSTDVSGTNECCTCKNMPYADVCCTCKTSNPIKMTIKGYEYLFNIGK